jgi:uncharacterized protein YbcI
MTPQQRGRGELAAALAAVVVKRLAEVSGRGPTRAVTTIGEDAILVVLEDALTSGERVLAQRGEGDAVLDMRRRWQRAMREDVSRDVEALTGRSVVAFLSDNQLEPDIAVEVFVLGDSLSPVGHPA